MKDTMETRIKVCPRCSRPYFGPSALSRADNETQICPDCGTKDIKSKFCPNCGRKKDE